jgi:hypothetical protein
MQVVLLTSDGFTASFYHHNPPKLVFKITSSGNVNERLFDEIYADEDLIVYKQREIYEASPR